VARSEHEMDAGLACTLIPFILILAVKLVGYFFSKIPDDSLPNSRNCLSTFISHLFNHRKTQEVLQKISGEKDESGQKDGRFSNGNVPNANWNDKFYVNNGYHLDNANPNLRARVEVSRI